MPQMSRAALVKGMLVSTAALLLFGASAVAAGDTVDASAPIPLWAHGAPGPKVAPAPQAGRRSPEGEHIISNITEPSMIPYLPAPGTATGVAVVVAPGGGHKELWMDHEGYRVGQWLSAHGIAAFVLKYRLSQQPGSPYSLEGDSLGDIQRAIRLVRSRSAQWHVDPKKVGVMGFSAGGELAALAGWRDAVVSGGDGDPVDAQSVRPDFEALIYPSIPTHGAFSAATPPTFLLAGDKDSPKVSEGVADLYLQIHRAGGSAEVHILAGVAHGFGMRDSNSSAIKAWPDMFRDWLEAQGFMASTRH